MPAHWNGYAYDSPSSARARRTRRDRRCIHCGGLIYKGEQYTNWNGYPGYPEHIDCCPTDPVEREQRGCKSGEVA